MPNIGSTVLPDLTFCQRAISSAENSQKEPISKTKGRKNANFFFQIYHQVQSQVNPYLAVY